MSAALDMLRAAHRDADVLGALAGADGLFIVVDPLGRITNAVGPAISLLAPDGRPLDGRPIPAALRGAPDLEEALREALDGMSYVTRCTIAEAELDVRVAPLRDGDGDILGAVAFGSEAVAVVASPAPMPMETVAPEGAVPGEPSTVVHHGEQESLLGRATIEATLSSAVRVARRGIVSALLQVRIGDLRLINRGLGREAGDAVLHDTAVALRELFPRPAVICRIGPADFAVVLEHLHGDPSAEATAATEAAVQRLQSVVMIGSDEVRRVARATVTLIETGAESPEDLLQQADDEIARLDTGRTLLWTIEEKTGLRAREDLRMVARLPRAGERGELRLLYQPIYSLPDNGLYGVEALLRWSDPELGPISPGRFIPLAESSGAVHDLGDWVIDELCRHAMDWDLEGRQFQLHFNASALELGRPDYARDVLRRINRQGLSPSRFVLEVTESTAVLDARRTFAVLAELRAEGMNVAIDDFGAGHSSLSRLKDLPADIVKIDRGIVADVSTSKQAVAIVSAAVSLATELGMTTVAEGIETDEQNALIVKAGCTYGQGFMLGRPSETVPR